MGRKKILIPKGVTTKGLIQKLGELKKKGKKPFIKGKGSGGIKIEFED